MRQTQEVLDSKIVADRIAHFEQKNSEQLPASVNYNNHTPVSSMNNYPPVNNKNKNLNHRYLDLDDIMEESSLEDDDSDGYNQSSPDTSFRSSSGRSGSSASDHSSGKETGSDSNTSNKTNISEKLSQKSLDSGFSDSDHSKHDLGLAEDKLRHMKSSVVHETHASKDSKLHHVSKVYFYSVSDLLQNNSTEYEDHLTLLKNEAGHDPSHSPKSTPRISSSVCDEDFFDRVESPFIPITSPAARESPLQRCGRVHTGTSSLRRKTKNKEADDSKFSDQQSPSPVRKCLTPSQSPFPITNGSLYSDLSLSRRNKEQSRRCKSDSNVSSSESDHNSIESPFPSLNCSFPLENYGLNVSISR